MNNWINVNDRLPPYYGKFLVFYGHNGSVSIKIWNNTAFGHTKNITHWQPLPEPPSKGSYGNQEDGMIDGIIECVTIHNDIPDNFWYSTLSGQKFKVRRPQLGEWRNAEGMTYDEELWVITEGQFEHNFIKKSHCL